MSQQIVDTNRPEYSWIPFFEELARRLHEDGWRHRQPEIVAELKRMRSEGMVISGWINNLTEWIDPFSLIGTARRQILFANAIEIMESFKSFFGVDADLPMEDPISPVLNNQSSFLFNNIGEDNQTETHWDLFEYVMSNDPSDDDSTLVELLNRSFDVLDRRVARLTGALFWIKPHEYLKTDTVGHYLNSRNYSDFGREYLDNLDKVRQVDSRPFPVLNADEYLTRGIGEANNVWAMNAGKENFARKWWLEGGYAGVSWDVITDLGPCGNDNEVRSALAPYPLEEDAINQIVDFRIGMRRGDVIVIRSEDAGWHHFGIVCSDITFLSPPDEDQDPHKVRKGVIWYPKLVRAGDLNLPGPKALQRVVKMKGVVLRRVTDVVRGRPDAPRDWVVRADGGKNTASFIEHGYVGTSWDELDLSACSNLDDIKAEIRGKQDNDDEQSIGRQAGTLKKFLFDMKPGDWVLTPNPPDEGTFYCGMVLGAPTFVTVDDQDNPTDGLPCRQRRPVEWFKDDVRRNDELPSNAWLQPTVYELKDEVRDTFLALIGAPSKKTAPREPYSIDTMIDEGVFLDEPELERIMAQLERKQNLILQGPPGTGKTFLAKRLAYTLMGERADERVSSVQFHQSYSYEDFVGGYRPDVNEQEQLVFRPRDGAFLRLCHEAREMPDAKFVMLIDEINRGNLSRVFGELLMLIEADKRSPAHAVELQHRISDVGEGDGKFFVPPNVYIIGTMNLADRSLTGMNIAMRRRFRFVDLCPQFESDTFKDWLSKIAGMPAWLIDQVVDSMRDLNDTIAGDASLGPQYKIGHSFFCPDAPMDTDAEWKAWYEAVVEFEIRPLLEEYWFDDARKAADEVAKLLAAS